MSKYIDGFLLPVPKKKLAAYRKIAAKAGKIWKKHGALEYRECILEDGKAEGLIPFPKAANVKPGETVIFSWIVYKSRAQRDEINAKIMADPRMKEMFAKTPFDAKRLIFGGFETFLEL